MDEEKGKPGRPPGANKGKPRKAKVNPSQPARLTPGEKRLRSLEGRKEFYVRIANNESLSLTMRMRALKELSLIEGDEAKAKCNAMLDYQRKLARSEKQLASEGTPQGEQVIFELPSNGRELPADTQGNEIIDAEVEEPSVVSLVPIKPSNG